MYAHIIAMIEYELSRCHPLHWEREYILQCKYYEYAIEPTLKA